ncbi:hypothetical protein MtrunA17_Chr2g0311771 [Medicago truncatula]|uniref:Uncharacterized protein n=1 Tax=Medicago truncatula TaxID=3880 RepID=A0A396JDN7_MEDTR|nr:hypothetical protein MtrunA17_Chr2g0311771 [Medicago truncatula]
MCSKTCLEKACNRYSWTNAICQYSMFNTLEFVICYQLTCLQKITDINNKSPGYRWYIDPLVLVKNLKATNNTVLEKHCEKTNIRMFGGSHC